MVVQIATLIIRAAALNPALRRIALAAINVLKARGLQAVSMNQFREAMISAGYAAQLKCLGEIAEVLF